MIPLCDLDKGVPLPAGPGQPAVRQAAIRAPKVVDTTGAGDCFTAAYAVALLEGKVSRAVYALRAPVYALRAPSPSHSHTLTELQLGGGLRGGAANLLTCSRRGMSVRYGQSHVCQLWAIAPSDPFLQVGKAAMEFASAAASICVQRMGAQTSMPLRAEVDQLLAQQ